MAEQLRINLNMEIPDRMEYWETFKFTLVSLLQPSLPLCMPLQGPFLLPLPASSPNLILEALLRWGGVSGFSGHLGRAGVGVLIGAG
jgi:hypothetical protein